MKNLLKIISYTGLLLSILPSILYFTEKISLIDNHWYMLAGMIIWFVTAPFWINDKINQNEKKTS